MDKLDRLQLRCDRVNSELHRIVKRLNEAGFKGISIEEASLEQDASLEIDENYSITLPTIHPNSAFEYNLVRLTSDGKIEFLYFKKLTDLIERLKLEQQKETKIMATENKNKTARKSTTLEPSLAKRQAELAEVDQDIEAIDTAIATLEASYKGVYNSWIDFEEGCTDRKANDVLLSKFEKTSTLVDELYEDLKAQRQSYVEGRQAIEKLMEAWTVKEPSGASKDSKKAKEPSGASKDSKKAKEPSKPKAVVTTKPMDADKIKTVNGMAEALRDGCKWEKIRVLDFQKATAKRPATLSFSKGRKVQIVSDSKIVVINGDATKEYKTKRVDVIVAALR